MDEQLERTPEGYTPPDWLIETATDPESIHACMKHIISKRYRINLLLGLILVVIGPTMMVLGETALGIIALIVGIHSLVVFTAFPTRAAKNQVNHLEEAFGDPTVPCQIVFWPQGVVVNNRLTGSQIHFRYELIRKIAREGDYLTWRTSEKKSVILRLQDVEDREGFLAYFKSKCPNAKCVNL